MSKIKDLSKKTIQVLQQEGLSGVQKRAKHYVELRKEKKPNPHAFKDVLFINGCPRDLLPHPPRYRVTYQKEQLESYGMSCDEVFYAQVSLDMVSRYRMFIIFRAPYREELGRFVRLAQQYNKKVYYDIDDLVFDTKYTNQIMHVSNMDPDEKKRYDQNVMDMQKMLCMCDGAITTTEALYEELKNYQNTVFLNRNVVSNELVRLSLSCSKKQEEKCIHVGYFSGSITHNDDFEMILPTLIFILKKYDFVRLHVVGELDFPKELEPFQNQIEVHPFMDYKKLPELIAKMDINLAPLRDTVFNRCKSEIKWIEASLVKVCTIASDVGAFHHAIKQEETGVLCRSLEDWNNNLVRLIENAPLRKAIANNAFTYCLHHCVSIYTGYPLKHFLESQTKKQAFFVISKVNISGGMMVVLKHMGFLQEAGWDVSFLSMYETRDCIEYDGHIFPILKLEAKDIEGHIQLAVATMWTSVSEVEQIPFVKSRAYFVQNFETDFYDFEDPLKDKANQSYSPNCPFVFYTMSKWCQKWLKEKYGQESYWIANGIDCNKFVSKERHSDKIRILIEGDCAAKHKNVDESFKIVETLDWNRYEIWYMSYNEKPKDWYHVDRFLHKVPYEKVASVYQECDILLKSSLLESFSYPPIEMMATGGTVVLVENDGNSEYVQDGINCLVYEVGNIEQAKEKIESIVKNENLRNQLIQGGKKLAESRDWKWIQDKVIEIYTKLNI